MSNTVNIGGYIYDIEDACKFEIMKYVGDAYGYVIDDSISSLNSFYERKAGYVLIHKIDEGIDEIENLSRYLTSPGYVFILTSKPLEDSKIPKSFHLIDTVQFRQGLLLNIIVYSINKITRKIVKGPSDFTVLRLTSAIGDSLQGWMVAANLAQKYPDKLIDFIVGSPVMPLIHPMASQIKNIRSWYVKIMNAYNHNLYAKYLSARGHNLINLAHSTESTLVKVKESPEYYWSDDQRRRYCQRSYNEYIMDLAGLSDNVPYLPFLSTKVEKASYEGRRSRDNFKEISWSVRGSCAHKWYPFMPEVVHMLFEAYPDGIRINLLADRSSDLIIEDILKIKSRSTNKKTCSHVCVYKGSLADVRKSIMIARESDLLIGPETGVMVALCHDPMKKLLFASHSHPKNFSDWFNTDFIIPETSDAPCWPCHRVQIGFIDCIMDDKYKTGAALCQAVIKPYTVYKMIIDSLKIKG